MSSMPPAAMAARKARYSSRRVRGLLHPRRRGDSHPVAVGRGASSALGRGFDVHIAQPDGRSSEKKLEVGTPPRLLRPIPTEFREAIQFASDRPRFGVTPLGTSHGFDARGDFTSFIIWVDGKGILVDPSSEALAYLDQIGVASVDVLYVFLTHVHADHDGGLVENW